MTLVSPERDLPAEPLPPDFGLEDAVRAITGLDFTDVRRHDTALTKSNNYSNLIEHAFSANQTLLSVYSAL